MSDEKKITVKEFKMWLEGVEEMQPEGWSPDNRQWMRIREKIDSVAETEPDHTLVKPAVNRPAPTMYAPGLAAVSPPMSSMPPGPPPHNMFGTAGTIKTPDIDTQTKPYESAFA